MEKSITLKIFAQRLRKLREQHNLSTRELGELVGASNATISRYETGKRDPDLKTAYKIAQHFGVTLGYLCGEEGNTNVETLVSLYSKLSQKSKLDAIKYIAYLFERGEKDE